MQHTSEPYLLGSQLTEVDVRLYPTIVRFDIVYVTVSIPISEEALALSLTTFCEQLFKTNLKTIRDGYPNIHRWLQHLYWDIPAFNETTNVEHIKKHYFKSLTPINPDVSEILYVRFL